MLLATAVADFLKEKEANSASNTHIFYRTALNSFRRHIPITYLHELDTSAVSAYALAIRVHSKATQASYRVGVKVFTAWCVRRKLLDADPCASVPFRKRHRPTLPTFFSRNELALLFGQAKHSQHPKRNVSILSTLLDTGIRAGELVNLRLRDIDYEASALTVDGKTGARVVPLGGRAMQALKLYVRSARIAPVHETHVYTTRGGRPFRRDHLTLTVRRWCLGAGITGLKLGPHTLRHTFAVMYIQAGGDAFSLQRIMGHANMDTTRIYVSMNVQQLGAAHAKFSPLSHL